MVDEAGITARPFVVCAVWHCVYGEEKTASSKICPLDRPKSSNGFLALVSSR